MAEASTAAPKKTKEGIFYTPVFRVSFPSVFTARAAEVGQTPKFSVGMIFPKVFTDPAEAAKFKAIKDAITAAAIGKWGPDRAKWPTNKIPGPVEGQMVTVSAIASPFHDGSEKDYDGYGPEVVYCTASSKIKPGLIAENKDIISEPSSFYGGCFAHATVTVFAYDNKKKGVGIGLRNIQKVRDGEAFGGSNAADDFDAIAAPSSAEVGSAGAQSDFGNGI